jgi:hypothetical protein
MELLSLAIQICCEVPRWKVPAAPALVKDPVALEKAIGHAESFFREVLAYDAPMGDVQKEAKKGSSKSLAAGGSTGRQLSVKQLKDQHIKNQLGVYDSIMNDMLGIRR